MGTNPFSIIPVMIITSFELHIYIVFNSFEKQETQNLIFLNINSCNRPNTVITMSESTSLEQRFKIGVLKELHKRELITKEELEKAIKTIKG